MSEPLRVILTVHDGDRVYQAEKVAPPGLVLPGQESSVEVGTLARGLLIAALAQDTAAQIRLEMERARTDG